MINSKRIKENNFVEWLEGIAKSNFVAKTIISILIWVVVLIPTWLYFGVRGLIDPVGFWQELALLAGALICAGWLQVIFIVFGVALTLALILED